MSPQASKHRLPTEGRVINIRRMVALDITLHGPRFIGIEFGVGTPAILAIGAYLMYTGPFILGAYLLLTGMNYVPLLAYAIMIIRGGSAKEEVAYYMSNDKHIVRKYSIQQLLLFLPLIVLLLSVSQEARGTKAPRPVSSL